MGTEEHTLHFSNLKLCNCDGQQYAKHLAKTNKWMAVKQQNILFNDWNLKICWMNCKIVGILRNPIEKQMKLCNIAAGDKWIVDW